MLFSESSRMELLSPCSMRSHRHEVPARSVCGGNMYQRELMKMKEVDPTRQVAALCQGRQLILGGLQRDLHVAMHWHDVTSL